MQIDVLAAGLAFPEGPAFAPDGSLWFVELEGGQIIRWQAGVLAPVACGGAPNGMAIDRAGRIWICDAAQRSIRRFTPEGAAWETLADRIDGVPLLNPNDLAFDRCGNLLFSCPGEDTKMPVGYVSCLQPDGTLRKVAEQFVFPNGLAFGQAGRTLIVAETYCRRLWSGTWDQARCHWADAHPWADVGGTTDGPDGMAVGANGLLYVAMYSLGCIKAVAADGSTVAEYALPGRNPTNCAFDPSGRLGLVVTEAAQGLLLSLPELGPGQPLFDGAVWG